MLRKLLDAQASAAKERLVNQKDKHGITPVFLTMQRCVVGGGEGMGFAYQGSSFFSYSRLPCCSLHRFSPCLFPHAAMLPCCHAAMLPHRVDEGQAALQYIISCGGQVNAAVPLLVTAPTDEA